MEVTKANTMAREIARYIAKHPMPVELSRRVSHITYGQGLDRDDLQQLTRKVRRILFDERRPRHAAR